MFLFKGKVAIVTGAGQGIGLEICKQLLSQGASVVLNDIDETLTQEAIQFLNKNGHTACVGIAGDSSKKECVAEMVALAVKQFGQLDIAIANAGITLFGDFLTYSESDFYSVINTNLGACFFLSQIAAQQMIQQGHGGAILLTSSVTAHTAHQHLAAYSMTKAAIEMLAKNLVVDLSPHKIRINTIAPGATLTERTLEDASYIKTWSGITPLGCPATPSDIAHTALFLVSEQARHITGQSLIVDGGWSSVSTSPFGQG